MIRKLFAGSVVLVYLSSNLIASQAGKMSLKTRGSVEIGVQTYKYKYEEEVDGASFMEESGPKYGVSVTGIKRLADGYYAIADIRYATGDVSYSSSSGTGDVTDKVYEARLLAGKEAEVRNYLLSSYTGVGYRMLKNDLRDLGIGGYRRTSQYIYIPIGILHRFHAGSSGRISTSIEYDYLAWAKQTSYYSDIDPLLIDIANKQKRGYGARISSAYEQEDWSIGLFLNYWKIGDSELNDYYYPIVIWEPKNETKEYGVQLKYRF